MIFEPIEDLPPQFVAYAGGEFIILRRVSDEDFDKIVEGPFGKIVGIPAYYRMRDGLLEVWPKQQIGVVAVFELKEWNCL